LLPKIKALSLAFGEASRLKKPLHTSIWKRLLPVVGIKLSLIPPHKIRK
jgi:hypothetical protein